MHLAAERFVRTMQRWLRFPTHVLEIGSRNVNQSPNRKLFSGKILFGVYTGIDLQSGDGVDVVADGAEFRPHPDVKYTMVLCTEVLEHTANARAICRNAFDLLCDGGVFLVTAAGEGRIPHGAAGSDLAEGEFYRNVTEAELREWLALFSIVLIDVSQPTDIYALAIK